MPNTKKAAKRAYIQDEAEVDGPVSPNPVSENFIAEKEMVDLTNWTNDSPYVDGSARSHRALEASRRKKAKKAEEPAPSTSSDKSEPESGEDGEREGEEDAEVERRKELLRKLREAKKESKAIEAGHFVARRVRCPLCHAQMSESTSEAGETHLWCPNRCILPYKASNEKARYLGELSARIRSKFVNPNRPPDCKHSETAALTHMGNNDKVRPELRDVLFFICPRKVADGRCNFVVAAEEEDELEAEFLETLYNNRNEKITKFAEDNRKANENSYELGVQAALKKKKEKLARKTC